MALIQCPNCEQDVSDVAAACPYCASPLTAQATRVARITDGIELGLLCVELLAELTQGNTRRDTCTLRSLGRTLVVESKSEPYGFLERGGVAIGDQILDLSAALKAGVWESEISNILEAAARPTLNQLMARGPQAWSALRLVEKLSQRTFLDGLKVRLKNWPWWRIAAALLALNWLYLCLTLPK